MANENELNPQDYVSGNVKDSVDSLKKLTGLSKEQRDTVRETRDILKDIDKAYERINARVDSYNKQTINVSRIEKDLEKVREKRNISEKRLEDIVKKIGETKEQLNEKLKRQSELSEKIRLNVLDQSEKQLALNELKNLEKDANLEIYKASLNSIKLSEKEIEAIEDKLEAEKKVKDTVGVTAAVLGKIGTILPGAKKMYGQIVEEARNGEVKTKNMAIGAAAFVGALTLATKVFSQFNSAFNALAGTEGGGPFSKITAPITDLIGKIPIVGGLFAGLFNTMSNILDLSLSVTSEIQKLGRFLGLSVGDAQKLNDEFNSIAINSGKAYVTVEKLKKSQMDLSQTLGINNLLNEEILKSNIQLQEQAGLELDVTAKLTNLAIVNGKTQTQIYKTIMGQKEALKDKLGIDLRTQQVTKELVSLTGVVGLTFLKYPKSLTESLLIVRSLGLDFQKLDGIASGLLDFENSISKEFEAQLFTGKDINLQKARELAFNNDLAGLAVEINKQLGSSGDFLKMNRLTQEAYAQAVGMSRDELAEMLRQQKIFSALGATDENSYKQKVQSLREMNTLQSTLVEKLGEEEAQRTLVSIATEDIASFLDKIRQGFANLLNNPSVKAFIDDVVKNLSDPAFIDSIIKKLMTVANYMLTITGSIIEGFGYLIHGVDYLVAGKIPNSIPEALVSAGQKIKGIQVSPITPVGASVSDSVLKRESANTQMIGATQRQSDRMPINLNLQAEFNNLKVSDNAFSQETRNLQYSLGDQSTGQLAKQ